MEVNAPCFVPYFVTVAVVGARNNKYNREVVLAPSWKYDGNSDIRFVLTWGARPLNLNLHLLIPHKEKPGKTWVEVSAGQTSNHQANFRQRMYNGHGLKILSHGNRTLEKDPYVQLTRDAKYGWGPEELVVRKSTPGTYILYVERLGDQMTTLQNSGAKLTIYHNNRLVNDVNVPNTGKSLTKNFWKILEFQGAAESSSSDSRLFQHRITNSILRLEPPQDAFL